MGWPGIDYEELGELGSALIGRDLIPFPHQAYVRLEKQLLLLKKAADDLFDRSGYVVAGEMSKRIRVIQEILHNPKVISEEEVGLDAPRPRS